MIKLISFFTLILFSTYIYSEECKIHPELHTRDTKALMDYIATLPVESNVGDCTIKIETETHCLYIESGFDIASYNVYVSVTKNNKPAAVFVITFDPDYRWMNPSIPYSFDLFSNVLISEKSLMAVRGYDAFPIPESRFTLLMDKNSSNHIVELSIRAENRKGTTYLENYRATCKN